MKTIVITGGSSGIGASAARALRAQGHTVVITGRSPETTRLASSIGADAYLVDFAKLSDVRAFAEKLLAKYRRIDVLVNNVGGVVNTRQLTVDGHEKTFQVNHLGGFLLTLLLRERLEASNATIINTASKAHQMGGRLDFDDLENAKRYSAWNAYGSAKLMNILHAAELNRRFKGIRAVSFHPGVVATGFAREGSSALKALYSGLLAKMFMISPEKGADTLVWLATSTDWTPGEYYVKRKPGKRSRQSRDVDGASRLWDVSEQMVR
ncbi:MAG TPA: SDR family NAD(P)-dependent oxidoreductase [Thermoanaerobaculia bacterium]|jgi:NAD(P)-dependent dehydrogenase (short-subunit alcohol dehydrogenase family)